MLRFALLPLLAGLLPRAFASPSSGIQARDQTSTVVFEVYNPDAFPPQNLFVYGSLPELGNWDTSKAMTLSPSGHTWSISLPLPSDTKFGYAYFLRQTNGTIQYDNERNRTDTTPDAGQTQTLNDTWCQDPADCSQEGGFPLDLSGLLGRRDTPLDPVVFELTVNNAQPGQNAFVYGNLPQLGNDNANQAMTLSPQGNNMYRISIPLPASTQFTYQYYITDSDGTTTNDKAGQRSDTTPASGSQTLDDTFCTDAASCPTGILRRQTGSQEMTVHFYVVSYTQPGQNMMVMGTPEPMGSMNPAAAMTMSPTNYPVWSLTMNVPANQPIVYQYFVKNSDGSDTQDQHAPRSTVTGPANSEQTISDTWCNDFSSCGTA